MDQNSKFKSIEKSLRHLELLGTNSIKDIGELENRFNMLSGLISGEDDVKRNIDHRINKLKENTKEGATLEVVSPRVFIRKKAMIAGITSGILLTAVAVTSGTLTSCGKTEQPIAPVAVEVEQPVEVVSENVVEEKPIVQEKVLSENLEFDCNDNIELVNRMSDFIADALSKGIPVKDIMTEDEIAIANEKEESLVTIEQLMDFYMVMNIEEIDPIDYARLSYTTKTAETITDNYMYCARVFMTDALTAKENDKIDYTTIIADKDSREAIQKFVDYLAQYNSSSDKKSVGNEIKEYIISNYINRDANLYTMSVNEFTYRLMFVADMISNNSILPTDVNVILNEDGKISCDMAKEDGVKDKTEKAEEFTSIYNAVEEKLEISREYTSQDLSSISEEELKTGVQLEKEIEELALTKTRGYNPNEKFTNAIGANVATKKGGSANNSYTTFSNGVNVSNAELAKYGAKTQAEYEAAKKAEFDRMAQNDPNHVIKDTDGNIVVNGPEADSGQYNNGYAAGYSDGNKKNSKNPNSSNASYVAGYNEGYDKGLADRLALDATLPPLSPVYDDVPDVPVDNEKVIIEQPYLPDPAVPTVPTEPTPGDDGSWEEFEPLESIETIDYTSSINNLKSIKSELLAAVESIEDTNSRQLS